MPRTVISSALDRLEQAWIEICNAQIEMAPDVFVKRMQRRSKQLGIHYSQEWMDAAVERISNPHLDARLRNLIFAECRPAEIRNASRRFDRALLRLLALSEFAFDEIAHFVSDEHKDELLRRFVWFRLFVSAEAHRKATQFSRSGRVVELDGFMPRVIMERAAINLSG